MLDPLEEKVMEQEARLRVVEKSHEMVIGLLRWILAVGVTAIIIPILLHKFGFG
jgi:hypothetical protein